MSEVEKLRDAQDFIARQLKIYGADRLDALTWEQDSHNSEAGIHRLVVFRGGGKSIITFTKYELLENYGSNEGEKQLRGHVGEILMEF